MSLTRKLNGDTVRALRTKAQVSVRALARSVGCSPSNISRAERGIQQPSEQIVASIASVLDVRVDAITYPVTDGKAAA